MIPILLGSVRLIFAVLVSSQSTHRAEYLALTEATLRAPITSDELRRAALSTEGVASIRALFEESLDTGLTLDGLWVTPELGGEAMLHEDGLELVVYPDPIHPVVRELVTRKDDLPQTLLKFLESSTEGRFLLKNTGGLHALLYQMSTAPSATQQELLDDILQRAAAQHFKTWSTDPLIQARMIESTRWRGRYVGFWHLHPPRVTAAGIGEGIEPSMADMQNAVELRQFLTIVFQPDGFDLYDLAPLASSARPDLSRARIYRHRSPEWRPHFEARLRMAQGSSVP